MAGKSTFMQLLQKCMMQRAVYLIDTSSKPEKEGVETTKKEEAEKEKVWTTLIDEQKRIEEQKSPQQREKYWQSLERRAQRQIFFVWFNAWQYTGETDIWAGLVVVSRRPCASAVVLVSFTIESYWAAHGAVDALNAAREPSTLSSRQRAERALCILQEVAKKIEESLPTFQGLVVKWRYNLQERPEVR